MDPNPCALETRDLHLFYRKAHALNGIDLAIPPRRITALIGPSGCGKTTLIRCFNRMNDGIDGARITGQVLVEGRDVYQSENNLEELRKKVGMVFQRSNPFPMSIRGNITFGPRMAGVRRAARLDEIVDRALTLADL